MVNFIEKYEETTNEKFIENIKEISELNKTIIDLDVKQQREVFSKIESYLLLIKEK